MKKIYIIFLLFCFLGCGTIPDTHGSNSSDAEIALKEERDSINKGYRTTKKFQEYIKKGFIELGMTKEEVRRSWGEPKKIKQKKIKNYDEIWIYTPSWKFKDKLFFKADILVATDPDYLVVSKMQGHGLIP